MEPHDYLRGKRQRDKPSTQLHQLENLLHTAVSMINAIELIFYDADTLNKRDPVSPNTRSRLLKVQRRAHELSEELWSLCAQHEAEDVDSS